MTVATPSNVLTIETPEARVLTDADRKEGVRILMSLKAVEEALRTDDSTAAQMIAAKVVRDEQDNDKFISFIRRFAGFEYSEQRVVVTGLVRLCFGISDDLIAAG
jgi:hypothetical protein